METDRTSSRPIFLLGVPRSGTTLLRALLGQHPDLKAGPENPWLCGSYGGVASLRALVENWESHTLGPVAAGIAPENVTRGAAALVDALLGGDGRRWVEKTPGHLPEVEFLHRLFPHAQYVHLVRDGRDVACSTGKQKNGGMWGEFLEHQQERLPNQKLMALLRWSRWNERFERWAEQHPLNRITLRYEDLVRHPEPTLETLSHFLELPFDPTVLTYPPKDFQSPPWELGGRDVQRWDRLAVSEIGKWESEFTFWEKALGQTFAGRTLGRYGYESGQLAAPSAPEYA